MLGVCLPDIKRRLDGKTSRIEPKGNFAHLFQVDKHLKQRKNAIYFFSIPKTLLPKL